MLAQEVGHESSSSTKLIALDPKLWVLHSNWSYVLPACWDRREKDVLKQM